MKKFKVRIEDAGKLIYFKNRKIRSPFIIELTEDELERFGITLNAAGVEKYTINEIKDEKEELEETISTEILEKEEVAIEEMDFTITSTPKTILEKLLQDSENGE